MKISVVYCTARRGGLDILCNSMFTQTYRDFEIIIVDELQRKFEYPDLDIKFITPPPKKPNMYWNLSASLNAGVRSSSGELIVLLQDYIYVPPDGLAKYISRTLKEPKGLISGVGHQYKEPSEPWEEWKWPGPPYGELTFIDPRMARQGFYLCIPVEWEANWSCFPKKVWYDIGGFDEDFDAGWGYDNVNFAERAQLAGYHLFLDTDNEVKCYSHINIFKEQGIRNAAPNNQSLWYKKYYELDRSMAPWKLNYC